jgi:hypothetical protein
VRVCAGHQKSFFGPLLSSPPNVALRKKERKKERKRRKIRGKKREPVWELIRLALDFAYDNIISLLLS